MIKTLDDVRDHADDFNFTEEQYASVEASVTHTMSILPEENIWTYWTEGTLLKDISELFYSLEDAKEQKEVARFYWSVIEMDEGLNNYSQTLGYPKGEDDE